jgi:LAO/AO transport system ATPase
LNFYASRKIVPGLNELVERFQRKDRQALSRLLTLASQPELAGDIQRAIGSVTGPGRVVAITGNGGVGKSSLIGGLIELVRAKGKTVAVLACDPESPLSGGALLGDRIRMSRPSDDAGIFIRSLAARSGQQAIAENLDLMTALLLDFGFDLVLIETVGAGQGDTAVRTLADVLVLLLQPQSGDELQWEKAGLPEVADIVVINKSDLPGADATAVQVGSQLNLPGGKEVPVLKSSATQGEGFIDLWTAIESLPSRKTSLEDS